MGAQPGKRDKIAVAVLAVAVGVGFVLAYCRAPEPAGRATTPTGTTTTLPAATSTACTSDFPVPVWHTRDESGLPVNPPHVAFCGKAGTGPQSPLVSADHRLPDGSTIAPSSPVVCGTCRRGGTFTTIPPTGR